MVFKMEFLSFGLYFCFGKRYNISTEQFYRKGFTVKVGRYAITETAFTDIKRDKRTPWPWKRSATT